MGLCTETKRERERMSWLLIDLVRIHSQQKGQDELPPLS